MNFRYHAGMLMLSVSLYACASDRVPLEIEPRGGNDQTVVTGGSSGTATGGTWMPGPTGGVPGGTGRGGSDGTGPRPPQNTAITVDPSYIDFGSVGVGSKAFRVLTIRNTGNATINDLFFLFEGDGAPFYAVPVDNRCRIPLPPGGVCEVQLTFGPGGAGGVSAALTVMTSTNGPPSAVIKLSGTGVFGEPRRALIGYWKFDEKFGSAVLDSSGASNHGTVRQGFTSTSPLHPSPVWEPGRKGAALRIDGLDDWVNVPDSDSIDTTGVNNAITISAWIKLDRYNDAKLFNVVVQRHMAATRVEQFFMGLNNGLPTVGINFFYGSGVNLVPLSTWVHFAMTYDGITQCGYINGEMAVCQDVGWPLATDETPVTIGAGINESDVNENINGLIDEVRLYSAPLTQADVKALYLTP